MTCSNMAENHSNLLGRLANSVRNHKILSLVVVIVVVAGLVTWHAEAAKSTSGGYLTRRVTTGDIASTVSAQATVQATQEVVLSFKNSGYVQSVSVSQGQYVTAGEVLAQEQSTDYQAQLEQAQASLSSAQAAYAKLVATQPDQVAQAQSQLTQAQSNLDLAKTTLAQDEALYAAGAISQTTLNSAQNTYQTDQAQVQSDQSNLTITANTGSVTEAADAVKTAQAGVTLAQDNLTGCEIVSSMNGYVTNLNGNTGEWTQGGAPASSASSSSTTSSQFTITVDSNQLELLAEINEADIAKVSNGDQATFTVNAFPNQTFTGKITSLAADATTVQGVQYYQAYASIDNQNGLKNGMPATMTIITAQANNAVVISRSALDYAATLVRGPNANADYVAILSGGKPKLVPVTVGIENDTMAQITSGLSAGQEVIMGSLAPGQAKSSAASATQGHGPSATTRAVHMIGG